MKRKDIMTLVISLFILVVAWIGFNIYHSYATSTITTAVGEQIAPIPGSFDTQTIEQIKSRIQAAPNFSTTPSSTQTAQAPVSITPGPTSSPSAIPTLAATNSASQATEGGTLR